MGAQVFEFCCVCVRLVSQHHDDHIRAVSSNSNLLSAQAHNDVCGTSSVLHSACTRCHLRGTEAGGEVCSACRFLHCTSACCDLRGTQARGDESSSYHRHLRWTTRNELLAASSCMWRTSASVCARIRPIFIGTRERTL